MRSHSPLHAPPVCSARQGGKQPGGGGHDRNPPAAPLLLLPAHRTGANPPSNRSAWSHEGAEAPPSTPRDRRGGMRQEGGVRTGESSRGDGPTEMRRARCRRHPRPVQSDPDVQAAGQARTTHAHGLGSTARTPRPALHESARGLNSTARALRSGRGTEEPTESVELSWPGRDRSSKNPDGGRSAAKSGASSMRAASGRGSSPAGPWHSRLYQGTALTAPAGPLYPRRRQWLGRHFRGTTFAAPAGRFYSLVPAERSVLPERTQGGAPQEQRGGSRRAVESGRGATAPAPRRCLARRSS